MILSQATYFLFLISCSFFIRVEYNTWVFSQSNMFLCVFFFWVLIIPIVLFNRLQSLQSIQPRLHFWKRQGSVKRAKLKNGKSEWVSSSKLLWSSAFGQSVPWCLAWCNFCHMWRLASMHQQKRPALWLMCSMPPKHCFQQAFSQNTKWESYKT